MARLAAVPGVTPRRFLALGTSRIQGKPGDPDVGRSRRVSDVTAALAGYAP
ncbi:hypothetical protein [Arthrobacter sp. NyZ413]|uniref:hypothetical protein n=1 Tax=Arthrobacter sp. NyZ413 TaxID=3144669 RepID=UPI003BF85E4E